MDPPPGARWLWLPTEGSWKYHLLLALTGMLVLGPLAGVTAAYMNFSLGFFVGGQVLAGLLGSAVTAGYGAAGRHGANYIQTAAASVARRRCKASSVTTRRSASFQASRSFAVTARHPPPSEFSHNTGRSLHTQGTPIQSDSSKGKPHPSASVGKTLARVPA